MKSKVLKKRMIATILLFMMLFMQILTNYSFAESGTVDYRGTVSWGGSKVGEFYVNGQIAFCLDHDTKTPPGGTGLDGDPTSDENIVKCLYYGWEGPAQWSGFASKAQGIVQTTLALDHYNHNTNRNVAQSFIDYIESQPLPQIWLSFEKNNLQAVLSGNQQITESSRVIGTSETYMTIKLQEGVTLINESRGIRYTDVATLYGGDSFHLEAPLSVNGNWTSPSIKNRAYKLQAIIYRSRSGGYQNLGGSLDWAIDPENSTNLVVDWLKTGNLEINKTDKQTNGPVGNTTYEIIGDNGVTRTVTTDEKGYAKAADLLIGNYTVKEITSNDNYLLDEEEKTVNIMPGQTTTLDLTNEYKTGNLSIIKKDIDNNRITLGHVGFKVKSHEFDSFVQYEEATDYYVPVSEEEATVFYTDWNGKLEIPNLRIGSYSLLEVQTNEWYELADSVDFEIIYNETTNFDVFNELKKGSVKIIKIDSETKETLPGAEFNVYLDENHNGILEENEKEEVLETLVTDNDGVATTKKYVIRDYEDLILEEVKAPEGYNLDSSLIPVKLEGGKTVEITKENIPITTKVNPEKKDKDTNKPLAGAEIEIYKDVDNDGTFNKNIDQLVAHLVSNEEGLTEELKLRYGTYFVVETKAPEKYNLNTEVQTFKVETQDQEIEIHVLDTKITNTIDIFKGSKNDSIKFNIKKNQGVSDTQFAIYQIDENGEIIDFAKDKLDHYVGRKVTINGKTYYAVTTTEKEKCKLNFLLENI